MNPGVLMVDECGVTLVEPAKVALVGEAIPEQEGLVELAEESSCE